LTIGDDMKRRRTVVVTCLLPLALVGMSRVSAARQEEAAVELSEQGRRLLAKYTDVLDSLKADVTAALPAIDEQRRAAFLSARAALAGLKEPGEDGSAEAKLEYRDRKERAESDALQSARAVLANVEQFLDDGSRDPKLMTIAILMHATPRGLAEFAQQGTGEEALLDGLFGDTALMEQVLLAGGANGGEYGEAMQVYAAIQEASERARKPGILQRLALGTALQQPWLASKEKGGVYGTVYTDNSTPDGQVSRYLHYEKAYLNGELDPAFRDMNTWECRFITNDPYTDEELGWTREMLRNYRPDHITNPDYKWRYVRMVKSDVPYCSPDWRPDEGTTKVQQIVAGGGKCGPRAFFGRTLARAFGIPSRRSTQTGHAAMNHWTPDGWVVCFGAWWSANWCGPWGGLDFLLESQAREHPEEFRKVLRAQWIGDALNEEDVSIRQYGQGGGLWNALAFYKKRAVVEDARIEALELAGGMKLGESDDLLGDEGGEQIVIRDVDRKIVVAEDGTITVPAAACASPANSTERIFFMNSLEGEAQVHYSRLGERPELLKYYIEVAKAGRYAMTMHMVTVARQQSCLLRLNRRTLIDVPLPYSKGMWQETEQVTMDLREGRNTLMLTCRTPNRGVSIKHFTLTPVK